MRVRLSVRMAAVIAVLLTPMVLLAFHLAETQRQRELEHIRAQAMLTAKAAAREYGRWTALTRTGPYHPNAKEAAAAGTLDSLWLESLVSNADFPVDTIVSVVDGSGRIIARFPGGPKFVGKQFLEADSFRTAVAQAREGFADSAGLDGVGRVIAYAGVPNADVYVRVGVPNHAAAAAGRKVLLTSFNVIALILALALGVAWLASRRLIVAPIQRLTDAAARLRAGDLGARTGVAHDESVVGGLAQKFDELASHGARMTRALQTLSAGNQTLLREREEPRLLAEMCRAAVERGGYLLALVNYALHDEHKNIKTVCHAGNDLGFIATLNLTWEDSERGRGTVGTAIRTGQPVVFRSIADDERFRPWREQALKRSFRSIVSLPLRVEGAVIGTFTLIAGEEDAFDEDEMKLLLEMAADLSFGIAVIRSEKKRLEAERIAQRALTHDPLVDLPNRSAFSLAVEEGIRVSAASGQPAAVLVVHLGRLQEIFDSFGYEPGNVVVREIAARLKAVPDTAERLARLPIEDFAVVLPGCGADQAAGVARKLLQVFQQPVTIGGAHVDVAAAIGASFYPGHGDEAEVLVRRAAIAAREGMRKDVPYYGFRGSSERENAGRLALATELRVAVEKRSLALRFQPKFDLSTGRACGAEALVRWPHATRGMIPPVEFIRIAEETGLIRQLTYHVLDLAVRQQHDCRNSGAALLPVAVNLSARNLYDPRLLEALDGLFSTWGLPRHAIEFEITESALVDDPETAKQVLGRLRDGGSKIYIDDFGTGYSSLNYLVALPVHALKIDRSFVNQMAKSAEAHSVVSSIISMAHSLKLRVVAEGVETAKDVESLKQLGCDEAQGYYFAKPMPAERYTQFSTIVS